MFEDWARLYDSVHAATGKDYAEEVRYLLRWMGPAPAVRISASVADERARGESTSARRSLDTATPGFPAGAARWTTHFVPGIEEPERPTVLDVACGTGEHLLHLGRRFQHFGVDASPQMLAVAREKLPGASLFVSDMTRFELGRTFDVVTCLFSSIGHVRSVPALERAIGKMAAHMADEGVLLIEPTIPPEPFELSEPTTIRFAHGHQEWERVTSVRTDGQTVQRRFVFRVLGDRGPAAESTGSEIEIVDEQAIRLFTDRELTGAMERAGLEVEHDSRGPTGIGLYIGRKSG